MRREYIVKQTANGTRVRRAPKPLSAAQCNVLVKLADGWELNIRHGSIAWLQLWSGRRSRTVNIATTRMLFSRSMLTKTADDGVLRTYTISESGHEALNADR